MFDRNVCAALLCMIVATGANAADQPAQKGEIVIGQTMPYSGPVSSGGTVGKAHAAYFEMLNEKGGINGRKVRLLSLDDAFSPPKTVEQTRRLIEQDEALLIFGSLGTATNRATQRYLNGKRVPQLFLTTGADLFSDPKNYPYTVPGVANYGAEAAVFAQHILQRMPNAKIAILSQNDDFGRTYVSAFKAALGENANKMIVAQATYEVTEPMISSQIVNLRASNADVLMNFSLGKFTAQAIQRVRELGWKPIQLVPYAVSSPKVLSQGGTPGELAGLISTGFAKTPSDPAWAEDPEYKDYLAWIRKYYAGADSSDDLNVLAYVSAGLLTYVLSAAGDDLSRENIIRIASNLKDVSADAAAWHHSEHVACELSDIRKGPAPAVRWNALVKAGGIEIWEDAEATLARDRRWSRLGQAEQEQLGDDVMMTREFLLMRRPKGIPAANNFKLGTRTLDPLAEGRVRVRTLLWGVDPDLRA